MTELERVIKEKGRNLEHVPRAPIGTYHQRLSLELHADEMLVACWGTQFPTTMGPICANVANNPFKNIEWIYAISRETAHNLLEKR